MKIRKPETEAEKKEAERLFAEVKEKTMAKLHKRKERAKEGAKERFRYILEWEDDESIAIDTTDPQELIDSLKELYEDTTETILDDTDTDFATQEIKKLVAHTDGISLWAIKVHCNGKLVRSFENLYLNKEMIKRLYNSNLNRRI